jgi:hypothetical protein
VLALRQAEAVAQRRDHLDADVHRLETRLATFPVVGLADPTTFAAEIVSWISAGRFQPSAADVYRVRIIGLVVAPSLAGVVLMLAAGLIGGRRQ